MSQFGEALHASGISAHTQVLRTHAIPFHHIDAARHCPGRLAGSRARRPDARYIP